jgi:hypothetical protein
LKAFLKKFSVKFNVFSPGGIMFYIKKKSMMCIVSLIIAMLFCQNNLSGRVKVLQPDKEVVKLSGHITRLGKIEFPGFFDTKKMSSSKLPARIIRLEGDKQAYVLMSKDRVLVFDPMARKVMNILDIPDIEKIIYLKEIDSYIVVHTKESENHLSKIPRTTGKIAWSIPYDYRSDFYTGGKHLKWLVTVPATYRLLENNSKLLLCGITYNKRMRDYKHRVSTIDLTRGQVINDKIFDNGRYLQEPMMFYMDRKSKRYEIIDRNTGNITMQGVLDKKDIPDRINRYRFVDVGIIPYYARGIAFTNWEFTPLLIKNGLLISTRMYVSRFKEGVPESYWLKIDPAQNKKEKIVPAPLAGIDMRIKNITGKPWPVIVPNLTYKGIGIIDKLWMIDEEGTIKEIPLPVMENVKYTRCLPAVYSPNDASNWVHDGEYLYYLHSKKGEENLFKFKIGSTDVKTICKSDGKSQLNTIEAVDKNFMVLSGTDKKLVRISDGQVIPPEKYSSELDTQLWKDLLSYAPLDKEAVKASMPATYKKLSQFGANPGEGKRIILKMKKSNLSFLSMWGFYDRPNNRGDMALKPAIMKDKYKVWSSMLVGVKIPDNRVDFYIPILRFFNVEPLITGSKDLDYYVYRVFQVDDEESRFLVLEDPETLQFYSVKRPVIK